MVLALALLAIIGVSDGGSATDAGLPDAGAPVTPAVQRVVASQFRSSSVVHLKVSREHSSDSISMLSEDAQSNYNVAQIEVVSLDAFCLSIVAKGDNALESALWRECFAAGRVIRVADDLKLPSTSGGNGHAFSLVLSSPVADSGEVSALARLTISSTKKEDK